MSPPSKKTKTQDNPIDLQDEQNRLLGLWSLVQDELKRKITGGDPTTIQALSELFPATAYPKLDESKCHCVFCHENFDPRVSGQTECIVEHDADDRERTSKFEERYEATCRNCEEYWEGEDDGDLVTGHCWEGPHTNDVSDRLDLNWNKDTEDDAIYEDGFDGCKECCKMLQQFKRDEEEDEEDDDETEENGKPTPVEQKKDPEVIVIDD
jgi:hypothetical protein